MRVFMSIYYCSRIANNQWLFEVPINCHPDVTDDLEFWLALFFKLTVQSYRRVPNSQCLPCELSRMKFKQKGFCLSSSDICKQRGGIRCLFPLSYSPGDTGSSRIRIERGSFRRELLYLIIEIPMTSFYACYQRIKTDE